MGCTINYARKGCGKKWRNHRSARGQPDSHLYILPERYSHTRKMSIATAMSKRTIADDFVNE